jgi:phytoene synthase
MGKAKDQAGAKAGREEGLEDLVRRVDEDRWLAAQFADRAARKRLHALYACNYEIARTAEVVSEPALGDIRLQWWREAIGALFEDGAAPPHPALAQLGELAAQGALDRATIDAMIDARAFDLTAQPFQTWSDLEAYIDATAGAVIRMAAAACAPNLQPSPLILQLFRECGRVWGYTGLVRALPIWTARRRTFFPARLMEHVKLTPEALFSGATIHETSAAARTVLDRASHAHREARRLAHNTPKEYFPAYGYVALAPIYMRGVDRTGEEAAPVSAFDRKLKLVMASATGNI